MAPDLPLMVVVDGTRHRLSPDETTVLGSGADAGIRVEVGPARWVRFRYAAGWRLYVLERGSRLEVDGVDVEPLGSSDVIGVEFAETGVVEAELSLGRHRLRLIVEIGDLAPPVRPGPRSPVLAAPPVPVRPPILVAPATPVTPAMPARRIRLGDVPLTIGRRGGGADVEVDGLDVALRHTVVRRGSSGVLVRDLNAGTGTFVDGRPVLHAPVSPGGCFLVGHHVFRVLGGDTIACENLATPPSLILSGLTIRHHRKEVPTLRDVSATLPSGGMLAIIGPSGLGKSTLCAGLLGEAVVEAGWAEVDGMPLGGAHRVNPALVSFVPQASSMLDELTVKQTMWHAARLRLAADATPAELAGSVRDVLERLHLHPFQDQTVSKLSGGQRRRLSVAVELLSDPLLLMLDEPTSGLDEGFDRMLMSDLAAVARDGCAVVIVTHTMAHLNESSAVLAIAASPAGENAPSGIGYLGPPEELLSRFSAVSAADVMDALREGRTAEMPVRLTAPRPVARSAATPALPRKGRTQPWQHVLAVSLRREFHRMWLRKKLLAGLALLGPLAAAAIATWTNDRGLVGSPDQPNPDLAMSIAVTAICLSLLAMALSLTSIVNDREVLRRESRWGVPDSAVVLSRAISRGVPALVQAVVATVVLSLGNELRQDTLTGLPAGVETGLVLAGLTWCSMCLGLLVSCLSATAEQAVGIMSGLSGGAVVLCGLVLPLGVSSGFEFVLGWASYLFPTRWAINALASSVDLPHAAIVHTDLMWSHDLTHLLAPLTVLFLMSALFCAVAPFALRKGRARPQR
ncbi:hypothetical protein GCM10017774_78610 [Lentzea cavernae]|uniref:ABC-type multidrug transport system, ATPase component n=2 Tax=Lentzea cavernae TaxID=2020703 RepID=A0ABQ3MT64_9PSEU|nr:hypothetical protein GCM10017774_78610 [Lentzea cavernae]